MALKFKRLITTLPAGTNTHTFTDNLINVNSVIEVYTDDDSVYPESVSQSGNTVTVTVVNHADFVRLAITINNFEKAVEYTAGTNVNITEDGVISSTGGSSISNLSDVSLTGLQGGNLLMYNHTLQKWVNANIDSTAVGDSVFGNVRTALSEHDTEIGQLQQNKQNKLTAGSNITIVNDVISATGGGGTASNLSDLNDVQLTSPTDKNLLLYNSQMQKWVNANITSEEVGDTEYGTVRDGFDELKQDLAQKIDDTKDDLEQRIGGTRIAYYRLIDGVTISPTHTSFALVSGRKFSDYNLLIVTVGDGGALRNPITLPREMFTSMDIEIDYSNLTILRYGFVHYENDTHLQAWGTSNSEQRLYVYGIKIFV